MSRAPAAARNRSTRPATVGELGSEGASPAETIHESEPEVEKEVQKEKDVVDKDNDRVDDVATRPVVVSERT